MGRVGFVGRAREREVLEARLAAALGGDGQVVLVAGEPGVGKSQLAEETVEHAARLGMVCAWGRATEDEGSPPYWPFRQVMRAVGGAALVAPEVGLASAAAQERFLLFEEVTEFLMAAAEPNGLLVVLDDVQWADPASERLLVHLARGTGRSRLAVLANYRDAEARDSLRSALAELAREPSVTRMRLGGAGLGGRRRVPAHSGQPVLRRRAGSVAG